MIPTALTCYCKKCGLDVRVGDTCPTCGGKLPPPRAVWRINHRPVLDWMAWNAALRVILPVAGLALALALGLQALMGGLTAVDALISGGLPAALLLLVCAALLLTGAVLLLSGRDVLECVADNKGVRVSVWLVNPTPLRLLARMKSPRLMEETEEDALAPVCVSTREISWTEVCRVQLWPEKRLMIFYAPRRWARVWLPCTPFSWEDAMDFARDHLSKRKQVTLPPELRPPEKVKASQGKQSGSSKAGGRKKSSAASAKPDAALMEDIIRMNQEEAARQAKEP